MSCLEPLKDDAFLTYMQREGRHFLFLCFKIGTPRACVELMMGREWVHGCQKMNENPAMDYRAACQKQYAVSICSIYSELELDCSFIPKSKAIVSIMRQEEPRLL